MTSEGILVKIIPSLDWGDLDFLLNERLARDQGDQHPVKHQFLDKIHVPMNELPLGTQKIVV